MRGRRLGVCSFGGVCSGCCGLVLGCLGLVEIDLVRVLSLGSSFGCCCGAFWGFVVMLG